MGGYERRVSLGGGQQQMAYRWQYGFLVVVSVIYQMSATLELPRRDEGYKVARLCRGEPASLVCPEGEMLVVYGGERGYTPSYETGPAGEIYCPPTEGACTVPWEHDGTCNTGRACTMARTNIEDFISTDCAVEADISLTNFLLVYYDCFSVSELGPFDMSVTQNAIVSEGYLVTPDFPGNVNTDVLANYTCVLSHGEIEDGEFTINLANLHTSISNHGDNCGVSLQLTSEADHIWTKCRSDYSVSPETYTTTRLYIRYQKRETGIVSKVWLGFAGPEPVHLQCWQGSEPNWDVIPLVKHSSPSPPDDNPGISLGLIAGVVAGAVSSVIIVTVVCLVAKRKKRPVAPVPPPPDEIAVKDGYDTIVPYDYHGLDNPRYTADAGIGVEHDYVRPRSGGIYEIPVRDPEQPPPMPPPPPPPMQPAWPRPPPPPPTPPLLPLNADPCHSDDTDDDFEPGVINPYADPPRD